ncbi:DUF5947 family protein [Thermostaphylospora chromogena]|uniref:Uncharacterized protein n=1 Tax=Thermostaphylospora chromogena TaxID=35622 RepID=A0A1H1H4V9_9ACTN|nr:DUF5947 family protein [Thermostaphylospora chromogena]SDR20487.1 hypothetical protein SAMN04489764_4063 [Thermostaphylospora chromogena]
MSTLARLLAGAARRDRPDAQGCELCGQDIPGDHAHLLETASRQAVCACRACAALFTDGQAGPAHYLRLPTRRLRLPGDLKDPRGAQADVTAGRTPDDLLAALGVPVGLAFVVTEQDGTAVAHYPSPLGATRWEVDPAAWRAVTAGCAPLRTMRPLVEALLVHTAHGARERWLVPVDDCFRLVALIRQEWRGLSGGDQVWAKIRLFFADLAVRAGEQG